MRKKWLGRREKDEEGGRALEETGEEKMALDRWSSLLLTLPLVILLSILGWAKVPRIMTRSFPLLDP